VLALGLLGFAAWLTKGRVSLSASVAVNDRGQDSLELTCSACEDGTVAWLGSLSATFQASRAQLSLPEPLKVGDNPFSFLLKLPKGKEHTVDLVVPVDYRIQGDLTGLSEESPKLKVDAQALQGTVVVVSGQPVTLDAMGKGAVSIDVSPALTGEASNIARLERKIPYTVTPPEREPIQGEVSLGIGIVPLVVEAPGPRIVTEKRDFMLAGYTQKGARLQVAGRTIPVDASGHFAQLMSVSAVGETTITLRASAAQLAPRLFPIRVRRVASLREEAQKSRSRFVRSYRTLSSGSEGKRGLPVELSGEVLEGRTTGHTTVLLVDIVQDCPARPCLARLVYADRYTADKNQRITAYGQLLGTVEGPRSGSRIPEARVDFILKGPPP
jgi:hypothetical protein